MIELVTPGAPPSRRTRVSETTAPAAVDEHGSETATAPPKPKLPVDGADEAQDAATQQKQLAMLARQQQRFNFMAMERAELQRETETMDTLFLAQLKHDAEVLKEWIREA